MAMKMLSLLFGFEYDSKLHVQNRIHNHDVPIHASIFGRFYWTFAYTASDTEMYFSIAQHQEGHICRIASRNERILSTKMWRERGFQSVGCVYVCFFFLSLLLLYSNAYSKIHIIDDGMRTVRHLLRSLAHIEIHTSNIINTQSFTTKTVYTYSIKTSIGNRKIGSTRILLGRNFWPNQIMELRRPKMLYVSAKSSGKCGVMEVGAGD